MPKIVAIGGGDIRQKSSKNSTFKIDSEIVSLSKKKNPNVLFIPTASNDSQTYVDAVKKRYGEQLGCRVDSLMLFQKITKKEIRLKIKNADIIYVGGGNTLRMMTIWRRLGVDKLLLAAAREGTILSGLSAGANCWFKLCNSDSRKYTSSSNQLIKVTCLNLVNLLYCPHYDSEKHRQSDLKRMMKNTPGVSVACEENTALKITGKTYEIIKSRKQAKAWKIYWLKGKFYKTALRSGLVSELISKN